MDGIHVQAHQPQVDKDEGCEERAREIQSLLDVGANGCRSSHRFCDAHEAIGIQCQESRIGSALARHVQVSMHLGRATANAWWSQIMLSSASHVGLTVLNESAARPRI